MIDTSTEEARIVPSCVEALQNYDQADYEGIMVLASRQAIHETIDAYWARVDACNALAAERAALKAELERLQVENDFMCAQLDSLPPPEHGLLKRRLKEIAEKKARAALRENTDD